MVLLIAPQCSCFRSVVHPRIRMVAGGDIYVRRDPDATSEVVSHLQAYTEFNAGHVIPVLFHPQDGWAAVYLGDGVPGWIAMSSPVFFVHPVTLTKRVVLLETSTRTKAMGVCGERESVDLLLRKPFGKIHAPLVGRSARSLDNWTLARTSSGRIGCFPQSPDQFVETATSESVNRTSSVFQGTWLMFALGGVIALALGVVGGIVVIAFFSAGMSWLRFVELYRRSAVKPGPPPS